MRIVIFAIGSAGDVHPFTGVGKALRDRGHEVIVATSPFFEEVVRRAGLDFRPMGTVADFERVQGDPHLWHPTRSLGSIIRQVVDPSYGTILNIAREVHRPGETVVLASSLAWGAMTAGELLGFPVASVHLAPSMFVSSYRQPVLAVPQVPQAMPRCLKSFQWWAADWVVDHLVLPELNRFRRAHGLAPVRHMTRGWHSPDRVIGLFPEWFGAPQPDWPAQTRLTGFPMFDESDQRPMSADLSSFLDDGDPPVVFTPGSAMDRGQAFFTVAVKALKQLGRRGILVSRFPGTIPADLPRGVRHAHYAPFSQLLPRAAAMVYHGGVGTCAQALRAGIPHLVQPMAHDQPDNLSRIRDLGVGDGLSPRLFTHRRVAATLDRLVSDPSLKLRAAEVATRCDPAGWLRRTCELIEEMKP